MTETVSYDRRSATSAESKGPDSDSAPGEPPSRQDRITFGHAARLYIAAGGEARYLPPLISLLGHHPVANVTLNHIEVLAAEICGDLSPATQNRRVYTPASAVLKFSAEQGWRDVLRLRRPRSRKPSVILPSQQELDAFGRAAGKALKLVIRFKLETGATEYEIRSLRWSHVHIGRRRAMLRRADGSIRVVGFSRALAEMLARLSGNLEGRVFRDDRGRAYTTRGDYGSRFKAAFTGASKRSGVKITFLTLHRIWRARQSDASYDIGSTLDG